RRSPELWHMSSTAAATWRTPWPPMRSCGWASPPPGSCCTTCSTRGPPVSRGSTRCTVGRPAWPWHSSSACGVPPSADVVGLGLGRALSRTSSRNLCRAVVVTLVALVGDVLLLQRLLLRRREPRQQCRDTGPQEREEHQC